MTFDEQHGWVELGTPGVHGGAVVRDLDAEVAALERMRERGHLDSYGWWGYTSAERYERFDDMMRWYVGQIEVDTEYARESIREGDPDGLRHFAAQLVTYELALLAPYVVIIRAGEAKRAANMDRWRPTPGGPRARRARLNVAAMLPARVETINLTVNLTADGGGVMEFDPEYGMVERGTEGHRASAQVVDLDAEIAALDRVKASPEYSLELARRRYDNVKIWQGELPARRRRHANH